MSTVTFRVGKILALRISPETTGATAIPRKLNSQNTILTQVDAKAKMRGPITKCRALRERERL